jgi:hypothetical protein
MRQEKNKFNENISFKVKFEHEIVVVVVGYYHSQITIKAIHEIS